MHLRENRIKLVDKKLVCFLPIGGDNQIVMLILVPQGLRKTVFNAYHASGVGGHLRINKTLAVLRLHFLWPNMRKDIISWV